MEKIQQKLHVYNSYLEINNEEIIDLNLEYELENHTVTNYENGKKAKEETKEYIIFDITGKTKDNREAYFSFELKLSLNDINKFDKKPVDISKYLFFDGLCSKVGDYEILFTDFKTSTSELEDMYSKTGSAYIYKKENNVFVFKIFAPEDKIFTYFEVYFNK